MKKLIVIGSGFAGLSAASFMARDGWDVTVLEKHEMAGGRARKFESAGFTFDMGPSWYWMPDVFERYFNCLGKKLEDYYELQRLDPSYRVFWPEEFTDIPADYNALKELFESLEKGAAKKLDDFLKEAAFKYEVGINKLVQKPGRSLTEFLDIDLARGVLKLDVFTSMKKHVGKFFSDPRLRQLMEFPVLFLGALPQNIPALYSLMNYADIKLGTWYPKGGMHEVVKGMQQVAMELGVKFEFNKEVQRLEIEAGQVSKVWVKNTQSAEEMLEYEADVVIGAADYHFIESKLLPKAYRSYNEAYWNNRVMAPSCLIYYVGLNKKLKNILHHNLFFDTDFQVHGQEIYESKEWPADPLFYVCATSQTDESVAPEGNENLFFLIPVAAGLEGDTEELRDRYFDKIADRFQKQTGERIKDNIVFKRSYSVSDFVYDYNAFKGNAYGLANTLTQTAILKPSLKSRKIKNLFYTGQLTVPGPGVPPSLISGEVVAREIIKEFKT
ncbi:MAG: phytoene desaturase [Chitinophagaceae bacterium]|nr:MAG: phytoene desaturase [Chitinophagaceae bacterium]